MTNIDLAIPQLPAKSMGATLAFYRRLGFDCEIVSPNDDYAIAERGTLEIHFFLYRDLPQESAFGCYFRVHDVDTLYQEYASFRLTQRWRAADHGTGRQTLGHARICLD